MSFIGKLFEVVSSTTEALVERGEKKRDDFLKRIAQEERKLRNKTDKELKEIIKDESSSTVKKIAAKNVLSNR